MLARRRRRAERLGLWSTTEKATSPSRAKQHGTRWGRPSTSTVASRATGAAAARRRSASSEPGPAVVTSHVDVEQDGRVVGRHALLSLAGVAVDQAPAHLLGQRLRQEHEVAAHAPPGAEVAGPVVPPGEQPVVVVELPEPV